MKKVLLLLAAVSFFYAQCKKNNGQTSDINLNQGLLAYYPLNGNANDSSGHNLNGVINGGVTFSADAKGNPGHAVTFDGTTGYILVTDNQGVLLSDTVSVSLLFNASNVTNRGALVNKVNFTNSTGMAYGIDISSPTSNQLLNFGVPSDTFSCTSSNYIPDSVDITNASPLSVNTWYHVVAIFAGSTQQIYVDGVLQTSVKRSFQNVHTCSNNPYLLIGGWWQGDIISFFGSVDEVRIYNRVLNSDEISQLGKAIQ